MKPVRGSPVATNPSRPIPVPVQQSRGPYEKIAESLRDDIRAGWLKPGDQLPTVAELAVTYTVAVGTAHRAMALLTDERLIEVTVDTAPLSRPTLLQQPPPPSVQPHDDGGSLLVVRRQRLEPEPADSRPVVVVIRGHRSLTEIFVFARARCL